MSTQDHEATLARVRENQRRSRARKREYLEELQQRLRNYELQGIEASAEVQVIARRVAEENRKLRDLLREHGYADEQIEQYVKSTMTADGTGSVSPQSSTIAAHTLEQSLTPRPLAVSEPSPSFTLPSQVKTITPSPPAMHSLPSWETISAEATPHFNAPGTDVSGLSPSTPQIYSNIPMGNTITGHDTQPYAQSAGSFGVDVSHTVVTSQPPSAYYPTSYPQQGSEYYGPGRGY